MPRKATTPACCGLFRESTTISMLRWLPRPAEVVDSQHGAPGQPIRGPVLLDSCSCHLYERIVRFWPRSGHTPFHSAMQQTRLQSNPYRPSTTSCPQLHPLFLCTTFIEVSCDRKKS